MLPSSPKFKQWCIRKGACNVSIQKLDRFNRINMSVQEMWERLSLEEKVWLLVRTKTKRQQVLNFFGQAVSPLIPLWEHAAGWAMGTLPQYPETLHDWEKLLMGMPHLCDYRYSCAVIRSCVECYVELRTLYGSKTSISSAYEILNILEGFAEDELAILHENLNRMSVGKVWHGIMLEIGQE